MRISTARSITFTSVGPFWNGRANRDLPDAEQAVAMRFDAAISYKFRVLHLGRTRGHNE